jgi:CheY-like chemotaxis protein
MLFKEEPRTPDKVIEKVIRTKIPAPAKILVIDDNLDNGTTIKVLLQEKHTVIPARDGNEGINSALRLKPDLILLDISLPGIDGFKVLEKIRKEDSLQNIPVIAVTARAMKGDREQILAHGFDDYISKPIDLSVFEETMNNWIC